MPELADRISRIFYHDRNRGKGAALRTGFGKATGDLVTVQDADLEYDPQQLSKLIQPILDGKADVVYGSRFVTGDYRRVLYFWHMLGNKFLTLLSNMLTNLNLSDMETCYKVFRKSFQIEGPDLRSRHLLFGKNLRGRQEDRMEGRGFGLAMRDKIQFVPAG